VLPETVIAKTATGSAKTRADSARRAGDTLEYDRAIPFKPGPGKELPPVKPR
jgi:hypothetical protein